MRLDDERLDAALLDGTRQFGRSLWSQAGRVRAALSDGLADDARSFSAEIDLLDMAAVEGVPDRLVAGLAIDDLIASLGAQGVSPAAAHDAVATWRRALQTARLIDEPSGFQPIMAGETTRDPSRATPMPLPPPPHLPADVSSLAPGPGWAQPSGLGGAPARRSLNAALMALVLALVAIAVFLALHFASDDTPRAASSSTTTTTAEGARVTGETPCPNVDGSSKRTSKFVLAPPMCIDVTKTYTAKFSTSKGDFVVTIDAAKAPETANNFVVLSRYHFYDGTVFHRIIADFMIQGGDPTATGAGGPGYAFADELPNAGEYRVGSIAMANSGKDTNGSQFFIITGPLGVQLPPSYSLFGKVTAGMDVVSTIGTTRSVATADNDGSPTEVITMNSVTITES